MRNFRLFVLVIASTTFFQICQSWHQCGNATNDGDDPPGFCPDGNKCCRHRGGRPPPKPTTTNENGSKGSATSSSYWGCISGDNAGTSECCPDHDGEDLSSSTGCRAGFICTVDHGGMCGLDEENVDDDNGLPFQLPRYQLCSIPHPSYQRSTYHLPSGAAYLSSHNISSAALADQRGLRAVDELWIIVHGSDSNADDYLCCLLSVAGGGVASDNPNIWILTPWFLPAGSATPGLQWPENPVPHTWRFGANAVSSNVSSFTVVDDLIAMAMSLVPALLRIIVAGHSAGGQYVQRWALLTDAWTTSAPTTRPTTTTTTTMTMTSTPTKTKTMKTTTTERPPQPYMRAIVANPKSFCWLDARRMVSSDNDNDGAAAVLLGLPNPAAIDNCPTYNEWEWGLGISMAPYRRDTHNTPYKDAALAVVGLPTIIERYNQARDVVYLAGEQDVLPNGSCEDHMQGEHRRQRSENFFQSLKSIYGAKALRHRRLVVKGVHHDHCLMFQSPEGREAFFGTLNSSVM